MTCANEHRDSGLFVRQLNSGRYDCGLYAVKFGLHSIMVDLKALDHGTFE